MNCSSEVFPILVVLFLALYLLVGRFALACVEDPLFAPSRHLKWWARIVFFAIWPIVAAGWLVRYFALEFIGFWRDK